MCGTAIIQVISIEVANIGNISLRFGQPVLIVLISSSSLSSLLLINQPHIPKVAIFIEELF